MISATKSTIIYAPASSKYGYTLSVNFNENSIDTENNTSNITINGSIYAKYINYSASPNTLAIYWIDNNENANPKLIKTLTLKDTERNKTYTVSETITVPHKNDGSLNGYARVVFTKIGTNQYAPPTTTLDTATTTLTSIPRATSCPSGTYYIEQVYSIQLNSASSSFTHKLTFTIGSKNFTLTGNSSITLDLNDPTLYNQFNTATLSVTATLTTLSGTTAIGSKTGKFVIACDKNLCKPTIKATYKDSNTTIVNLTGNNQKILKNKSTLVMTITPTAKHSTIDRVTIDGVKNSSNTSYTDSSPNKKSYILKAFDKRGFESDEFILTINLIDYVDLSCSVEFYRVSPTTGEVGVKYSGNYFNSSFGNVSNTLTVKYQYREKGTTTWSTAVSLQPVLKNNTYSQEKSIGSIYNYKKIYEFKLLVSDKLNNFAIEKIVAKGEPIFWTNGEKLNLLVDLFVKGKKLVDYLYPVGSIYMSVNSTKPNTLFGGTWIQLKDTFLLAAGDTYLAGKTGGTASHSHNLDTDSAIASIQLNNDGEILYKEMQSSIGNHQKNYSIKTGGTGATASYTSAWGAKLYGYTQNSNNLPPYTTVYVWKRTK